MLKAGVLGATDIVSQIFIQLLNGHPWLEVSVVAASEKSAGTKYSKAANWTLPTSIRENVADLQVVEMKTEKVKNVGLAFSALPAEVAGKVEENFAKAGHLVVGNVASHRMDSDVLLINAEYLKTKKYV